MENKLEGERERLGSLISDIGRSSIDREARFNRERSKFSSSFGNMYQNTLEKINMINAQLETNEGFLDKLVGLFSKLRRLLGKGSCVSDVVLPKERTNEVSVLLTDNFDENMMNNVNSGGQMNNVNSRMQMFYVFASVGTDGDTKLDNNGFNKCNNGAVEQGQNKNNKSVEMEKGCNE